MVNPNMNVANSIWTEKYRPQTLDDIVGQEAHIERLKQFLDADTSDGSGGGLAHCLFAGPPGVGKTATTVAYAKGVFGENWRENLQETNASGDRGIDHVRNDIKDWCRTSPAGGAPYKIVFLDEVDALTKDAQSALRRIMEQYSDTTRFILSCNYVNQIIDPIQSRCAPFHFAHLDDTAIHEITETVIYGEDIEAEDAAVEKVVRAADGDARRAINNLQSSVVDGELTEDFVESVVGVVDDQLVFDICQTAVQGDLEEAMQRFDVELLKNGANYQVLVDSLFTAIRRLDLQPDSRVKCLDLLATTDERLRSGLNPHVQFHNLLGHLYIAQGLSVYGQQEVDA